MAKIFNLRMEDGIAVVTFDVPGSTMNALSGEVFPDYAILAEELDNEKNLKGVIFISGKPGSFSAGGDLNFIATLDSEEKGLAGVKGIHEYAKHISSRNYPSIAAVNGLCLGGGLELILACGARIAKEGKTMFGLPEINVGLFPGGGGTQRLPRLIGYPAIDMILKGSVVDAKKALDLGIVDRLVSAETDLLAAAKAFLMEVVEGKANLKRPSHDFSNLDEMIEKARREVLKASRGRELPAPMLALDAIKRGLKVSLEEGSQIEKENFVKVAVSREAKGSINTFFIKGLTDKPKTMMTKGFTPKAINSIAILGFGTMGRGIIIDVLRNTNIQVIVKDDAEAIEPGKAFVRKILDGMAAKKRLKEPVDSIMDRLKTVTEYAADFGNVDLLIEAVFEDLTVKEQVYKDISKVIREDCIVSSNTSFLPINKMAKIISHPERFGGTHFFSPVWQMQLVEVVRGDTTSQETVDNLLNFAGLIRKRPIICKDNPGFVVNALLFPYMQYSYQCIEEGTPIEMVDNAMVKFGMPVGVIRLTDEVGIDVPQKTYKNQGIPVETLENVVAAGRLGLKKSGKGFFLADGSVDPTVMPLIGKRAPVAHTEEEIQESSMEAFVRTGKDLLDRGIVNDARMIDVGCIWGFGFPSDKGGPLKWADLTGLSKKLFGKNFY